MSVLNHYRQAVDGFTHHKYESANGDLRTALEDLWVPRTSPTSCDQPVFVDHASDASVPSDTALLKFDRFG
jgi:hypothetical protein